MQAKQRFRAALYKLSTVEKLSTLDKHVKHYRLCLNANRRADIMSKYKLIAAMHTYVILVMVKWFQFTDVLNV